MRVWKEEKEHWYVTEELIKEITEGKCLECGKELKEEEIKKTIKEENYKDAGSCKKCQEKRSKK